MGAQRSLLSPARSRGVQARSSRCGDRIRRRRAFRVGDTLRRSRRAHDRLFRSSQVGAAKPETTFGRRRTAAFQAAAYVSRNPSGRHAAVRTRVPRAKAATSFTQSKQVAAMTSITQVCCELELARSTPSSGGGSRSRAVLAASCGGCSLIFIGGAVVNVALAAIGHDLALEDRYGQRRIFLLGIALFGAASLGCAMSSDWPELVFFRLLQGVGEALILPAGLTILSGAFSDDRKGAAVGIWSASAAVASAIAPAVAGLILDYGSWRATFLMQVPLAVLAFMVAYAWVRPAPHDVRAPIDIPAAALSILGLTALGWSLMKLSNP